MDKRARKRFHKKLITMQNINGKMVGRTAWLLLKKN